MKNIIAIIATLALCGCGSMTVEDQKIEQTECIEKGMYPETVTIYYNGKKSNDVAYIRCTKSLDKGWYTNG